MSLEIDLSSLRQNPGRTKDMVLESKHIEGLPNGLTLSEPVQVHLHLEASERQVMMTGHIDTGIDTQCDRCLVPVHYQLSFDFSESLMSTHDVDILCQHGKDRELLETEHWLYDSAHLDLNYMLLDKLLSQLPFQHLCQDDCRGLCPHCGINLNEDTCSCDNQEIDPRWAILAQLKDNK